ncbi:hypothetical protein HQN89_10985 [Paenibacillus frigoriresistens]|uniref:hypothetical protein n=1 Tax=Paenibacillus alginolyticus TaxID=59839 RepID=UPI001567905B|nr:hypothetical protein [Paenibacillus frigoriresistens]NRF91544.1 hypothetical protein [Paenibacillus frigoriresistens]
MSKVKITGGMNPTSTKIMIDGQPLKGARAISYSVSVDEIPTLTAEIYLDETDIEVDAMLNITADVCGKRYRLVEMLLSDRK